jgi:hypothetical protein
MFPMNQIDSWGPKRLLGSAITKKVESHAPSFVQVCLDFKEVPNIVVISPVQNLP